MPLAPNGPRPGAAIIAAVLALGGCSGAPDAARSTYAIPGATLVPVAMRVCGPGTLIGVTANCPLASTRGVGAE